MIEEYVDSMQILDLLVNSENLGIQWCYSLYSVIVCTIVMIYTEEDVIVYCTMIPCSDKQELHSIKVSAGMCLKQCNDDAIRELSWESARGWGWVCSNNATHWLLSINHCSTAACSLQPGHYNTNCSLTIITDMNNSNWSNISVMLLPE